MSHPERIANRYRILERIGEGGMGTVFKVHDRLSSQVVALKCVTVSEKLHEQTPSTLSAGESDMRVALTKEFRTLATLRHPHIISVLDYGFTTDLNPTISMPYFTMELLTGVDDIVSYAAGKSDQEKISLIIQILQALAYLHRRGIVHRDLKPSNVLVVGGQIKLLDFGLAFTPDLSDESVQDRVVGTLGYMAPEVLRGDSTSEISDLYGVGVIAYQLFGGQHPYNLSELTHFIETLFTQEPDMTLLRADPAIVQIIKRLMAKKPKARFQSAHNALESIHQVTKQAITSNSTVRESYLQAARFVGREKEVATLTVALNQAINGKGSSWLIGGESGVGKSRLVDEIRCQALVEGFQVLRGESITGSGLPFMLWRQSLRPLMLSVDINDLEASIIKEIIPDLATLIERDIPGAPPLDGHAGRERLINTIIGVFRRVRQPTLVLLENLHWSSESLEPLKAMNQIVANIPVMIVGTYSEDAHPDLPNELPDMRLLRLDRLSPASIHELSASILGAAGDDPAILRLLERETEGNTFFIVEVIRALAESAGDLEKVGEMALPTQVSTGGLQAFIERRLRNVPDYAQPLLKAAAVAGRHIDLQVIRAINASYPPDDQLDLTVWLTDCANAAVLEIHEEKWRFAHDKLRDAVLDKLTESEKPGLHRLVAEGIEAAHPNDATWSAPLVDHWKAAGDLAKSVKYAIVTGERALLVGLFDRGKRLLTGVLDALPDDAPDTYRLELFGLLGALFWRTGDYDQGMAYFEHCFSLAERIGDKSHMANALNGMAFIDTLRDDQEQAQRRSQQALKYAIDAGEKISSARALSTLGVVAESQADYDTANMHYTRSLAIFRQMNDQRGIASVLNNLGSVADSRGQLEQATSYYSESLEICRTIGYRQGISSLLNNIGILNERLNKLENAFEAYQESLRIAQEIGDRRGCAHNYANLTFAALGLGRYDEARDYVEKALVITDSLDISYIMPHVLAGYAWLNYLDGKPEQGTEIAGAVLEIASLDEDFCTLRFNTLMERLSDELPAAVFSAALERGKARPISDVVKSLTPQSDAPV
jgi:serine/threonine protein kinase/tetratricopeptide (TPR) repeat protein